MPRPITTKSLFAFALVAVALSLGACGNKTSSVRSAETEGVYLNVGQLKYQVEISRQLNPESIPEDRTFIADVAPGQATLGPGQLWFAVFVRVENPTRHAQVPARDFSIVDTEGNVFTPVAFRPGNPFAYSQARIPPKGVLPNPDSVPAQVGSIGGMELLFKLDYTTLDNRPLELRIHSLVPSDEAHGTLDV
jgi:hypothetical protein